MNLKFAFVYRHVGMFQKGFGYTNYIWFIS